MYISGIKKAIDFIDGNLDKLCFEALPEEPKNGKFIVDIYVSVKPI